MNFSFNLALAYIMQQEFLFAMDDPSDFVGLMLR